MQPAAFPSTVCDLWGGPQGICRALLSQLFPLISLVICTAHASESLWIVMLPLLPGEGLLVSRQVFGQVSYFQ